MTAADQKLKSVERENECHDDDHGQQGADDKSAVGGGKWQR